MQYILFSQNAIRTAHIKHDKLAYLAPLWRQIFFPRYPKAPKEKTWGWNQADHGLKKSPNCAWAKKGAVIRQFRFVKVNHFPKGYTIAAICSKGGLRGAHIIPKGGWFYYHHMCTHKSLYGKKAYSCHGIEISNDIRQLWWTKSDKNQIPKLLHHLLNEIIPNTGR